MTHLVSSDPVPRAPAWSIAGAALGCCLLVACRPGADPRLSPQLAQPSADVGAGAGAAAVRSSPAIDLAECLGADCSAVAVDRPPLTGTLRTCDVGQPSSLATDWVEWFVGAVPPTDCPECDPEPSAVQCPGLGACFIQDFKVAVAPDQSIWALGVVTGTDRSERLGGLWLAKYAATGARLFEAVVQSEQRAEGERVAYTGELSVDARAHVFVAGRKITHAAAAADYEFEASAWIDEFDDQGLPQGESVSVLGVNPYAVDGAAPRVVPAPGGLLVVYQPQLAEGAIALCSADTFEPRWVVPRQQRIGFSALQNDSQGRITLLTRSPDGLASGHLEQYDASGTLTWQRALPWLEKRETFWDYGLGLDRDDNLIQVSLYYPEWFEPWVVKLNAQGELLWYVRVQAPTPQLGQRSFAVPRAIPDRRGDLLIPAGSFQRAGPADTLIGPKSFMLYEVSADGERCHLYLSEADLPSMEQHAVMDDGSIIVGGRSGFARLHRP
jgi:hypothetical protein